MASELPFRSILFPVDFSEASAATAPHVRGMAELTGATVRLLHVVPWLAAWYGATELRAAVLGDPALRQLEEQGRIELEKFQQEHFSGILCCSEVRSGAVAETITDTAGASETSLIMMPTSGLGRSRPFLIGSTAAKVLHDAQCAVWTSPHLGSLLTFKPYKFILCTLDRDDIPQGYLEAAAHLALFFKSKLSFITAHPSSVGGLGQEYRVESLAHEFPQAPSRPVTMPPDCTVLTETGPIGDVVRRVVRSQHVDLVLTHRGHLQHAFGRFRTHTYDIVVESPCPVLSLCMFSASGPGLGAETNVPANTSPKYWASR